MKTTVGFAQNLVTNPDFETYSQCPTTYGNGGPLEGIPWQNGNLATADYFNACATGTDVWVPDNLLGSQPAHSGNAYAGFFTRESSVWREYVQGPLLSPLVAGTTYTVSFYVSLADSYCAVQNIGAHLSGIPPDGNTIGTLNVVPQIEANLGYINDTENWTLITGCFTAAGGEEWITIGNYYNNANTPLEPGCNVSFASYYYVDDVSVIEGDPAEPIALDLGDPVTTCGPYEIDPGITDVDYHWSTGATTETIVVSTSGTYRLTVTSGCNIGIDSVEITIGETPNVEIGPPSIDFCEGENYVINLNPSAGEYEWQDGSTSPNYTISSTGTYAVTLTNDCGSSTDAIEVNVIQAPEEISLGQDLLLCNGEDLTFSFDSDLGSFLWQDGSTSSSYTIVDPGIYSLTVSNTCGESSDELMVTSAQTPVVDIGPATIGLCENESYTITLDPNSGDYLWQDGSQSFNYSISGAGVYAVTVTNACGVSTDEMEVAVIEAPESFSLGNDTAICDGTFIQFEFDPGLGSFSWQDNSTSSTYQIAESGLYSLTISNSCGEVSDEILVTEISMPSVDLGVDMVLCEGQQAVLNVDPLMGDILWQDGTTNATLIITEAGTFGVTITNACGEDSDEIIISLVEAPTIDLGPDLLVCPAQLPIILDAGTATNATSFLWQDNSSGQQMNIIAGGTYAVTVSNSCFSATDQIQVNVADESPTVSLPDDQLLCEGQSVLLNAGGLIGTYAWQDGSSQQEFLVMQPGTYSLTVTNQCGTNADTIQVSYMSSPDLVNLGPDFSLCPGETFLLNVNAPSGNFVWQDDSQADTFLVTAPGVYHVQVYNQCGASTDTLIVMSDHNPPQLDLPALINLCQGDSVWLESNIGGVTYHWNDGSATSSLNVHFPGTYFLMVSNACGQDLDSVQVVDAGTVPSIIADDMAICPGDTAIIVPLFNQIDQWLWSDGSTQSYISTTNAGIITVQGSNACGVGYDTVEVTILPNVPLFDLGNDTTLCPGEFITLQLDVSDVSIHWSDGSMADSFVVADASQVWANVENQCGSFTDSIAIEMIPELPSPDLGADQSLCPGESILLVADIGDVQFTWNDGSTDSTLLVLTGGEYALTITNLCESKADTIEVLENNNGPVVALGDDIVSCSGEQVLLTANVLGVDYLWQDGSTGQHLVVTNPGQYTVQVSNACGTSADSINVRFIQKPDEFDLGPDTTICPGDFLVLNAPSTMDQIVWQDGSHDMDFIADEAQTYFLVISNICGEARDEMTISYDQHKPVLDLGTQYSICEGETVMLDATQLFNATYLWSNGEHASVIGITQSGVYTVTVSATCESVEGTVNVIVENCGQTIGSPYIPNIFSPNGDQINDIWTIHWADDLIPDKVQCNIFDRWGNQVFQSSDPGFQWDGTFHHAALPPGVYAFIMTTATDLEGKTRKRYAGDVTIVR